MENNPTNDEVDRTLLVPRAMQDSAADLMDRALYAPSATVALLTYDRPMTNLRTQWAIDRDSVTVEGLALLKRHIAILQWVIQTASENNYLSEMTKLISGAPLAHLEQAVRQPDETRAAIAAHFAGYLEFCERQP